MFLKGLRSGVKAGELTKIIKKYKKLRGLDIKDAFINRLIQANKEVFKEVTTMNKEMKKGAS